MLQVPSDFGSSRGSSQRERSRQGQAPHAQIRRKGERQWSDFTASPALPSKVNLSFSTRHSQKHLAIRRTCENPELWVILGISFDKGHRQHLRWIHWNWAV